MCVSLKFVHRHGSICNMNEEDTNALHSQLGGNLRVELHSFFKIKLQIVF